MFSIPSDTEELWARRRETSFFRPSDEIGFSFGPMAGLDFSSYPLLDDPTRCIPPPLPPGRQTPRNARFPLLLRRAFLKEIPPPILRKIPFFPVSRELPPGEKISSSTNIPY